jgi:hypothetical protein
MNDPAHIFVVDDDLPIEGTSTGGPLALRPMSLERALTNLVDNGFE